LTVCLGRHPWGAGVELDLRASPRKAALRRSGCTSRCAVAVALWRLRHWEPGKERPEVRVDLPAFGARLRGVP
jgi:hypothetical protein